jgi:hypothetical protein
VIPAKRGNLLFGGLEHEFYLFHILGRTIPTDELIFFRGVGLNHQPVEVSNEALDTLWCHKTWLEIHPLHWCQRASFEKPPF